MKIRKLESKDIPQVVNLEKNLLNSTLGESYLNKAINSEFNIILVATIDELVIGYISSSYIYPELEILNFCVDEKYQHQGIGQKLFDNLVKNSKANKIFLDVKSTNSKGRSFYFKNGFKEISVRKSYYADSSDDIVMMKEII